MGLDSRGLRYASPFDYIHAKYEKVLIQVCNGLVSIRMTGRSSRVLGSSLVENGIDSRQSFQVAKNLNQLGVEGS